MPNTDTPLNKQPENSWRLLGEIESTVSSDTEHTVGKQLTMILISLNLPTDFLNRVLRSAADCIAHAFQTNGEVLFRHVHLSVFASNKLNSGRGNWGFFRIEKVDSSYRNEDRPPHEVEFYLYVEGQ